jgi:hypothetical protein
MPNPNPKTDHLTPFAKGDERINKNGRPRKFTTTLKEQGYKLSEINDAIQVMLSMTIDELKDIYQNDQATILEKTIANAMVTSLKKGSLYSIETLLSRVWGTPKMTTDVNVVASINVQAPDEETKLAIDTL